ncbi:MAG: hypothetical protein R2801_09435 [Chitinophagales bacterium]
MHYEIAHQGNYIIGVYHSTINNQFCVSLALSTDLIHWEFKKQLATKASQQLFARSNNNNFVVTGTRNQTIILK